MKTLLLLVIFWVPNANAININKAKNKVITMLEAKAKKYEIVKQLDKATNIVYKDTNIRIRPDKIEILNKGLNIQTNLKDNIKVNFKFSF